MTNDIERRLRAVYHASERLLGESGASGDEPSEPLSPRVSRDPTFRRARLMPILAAAVVVLAVVAVTLVVMRGGAHRHAATPTTVRQSASRSPAASTQKSGRGAYESPPAAVTVAAHGAVTTNTALRVDQPGEWVRTTSDRWDALNGESASATVAEVYIVQIRGDFICKICKGQSKTAIHGSTIVLVLPVYAQTGGGITFGNTTYDLSRLGNTHNFIVS